MADPNDSCTVRFDWDFLFISHQVRKGIAIPDAILKAEQGQP